MHVVLGSIGVLFSIPFVWLIVTSFKQRSEIFRIPMTWIPEVFKQHPVDWPLAFQNFTNAQQFIPMWSWLGNTLYVTLLSVALNVV
jgi:ABC-type glycerol-3-phosphate transport system permease component